MRFGSYQKARNAQKDSEQQRRKPKHNSMPKVRGWSMRQHQVRRQRQVRGWLQRIATTVQQRLLPRRR